MLQVFHIPWTVDMCSTYRVVDWVFIVKISMAVDLVYVFMYHLTLDWGGRLKINKYIK